MKNLFSQTNKEELDVFHFKKDFHLMYHITFYS